jgi:hypothetical protein
MKDLTYSESARVLRLKTLKAYPSYGEHYRIHQRIRDTMIEDSSIRLYTVKECKPTGEQSES